MVRLDRLVVAVCAVALAGSACTMKKTEQPPLSGPSELGLSLSLYANPDVVSQDGASQSVVVIYARDQAGQAIKNLPLRFDLSVNNPASAAGKLSSSSANTDSDGRATVTYTAPPALTGTVDVGTIVTVNVTPTGTDYGNAVARSVSIRLVPSGTPGTGPVASFSYSPTIAALNAPVTFNGAASRSDAAITSYTWNFGDGSVGTGVSPQHIYRSAGQYTVTLVVADASGRTSNPSTQLIVVGVAVDSTADFTFSPGSPRVGGIIFFDASTSKAGAGRTIVDYTWNLGEGSNPRKGITLTWAYAASGAYTVTLRITDDLGKTFTVAKTVTVTP